MHAVDAGRAGELWATLGQSLPRPKAVLIASAHWETELPMVSTARQPETIHDFGGFPAELYKIRYPAPGAQDVGERAVQLLNAVGLSASANGCRGLDHGAWVPMLRMFPNADVPVTQVSIQPSLDAAHHLRLGAALAPLTQDGVLIVGSGHMTHNLREWMSSVRSRGSMQVVDAPVAEYVKQFRDWIDDTIERDDRTALTRWQQLAPYAERAHPTPEHLLPLFVALGAASEQPVVERLEAGVDSGVLAMDAYVFWPRVSAKAQRVAVS